MKRALVALVTTAAVCHPVALGLPSSSDAATLVSVRSVKPIDPRGYAQRATRSAVEFGCLVRLWTRESNWNPRSRNRTPVWQGGVPKHAFGIAQLVGEKATDARTQIDHGLAYIRDRYPLGACQALSFSDRHGYY